jgi:hypothetical protein
MIEFIKSEGKCYLEDTDAYGRVSNKGQIFSFGGYGLDPGNCGEGPMEGSYEDGKSLRMS